MDWKYKPFHQERVFPASGDPAFEAVRTFMAESLGWGAKRVRHVFAGKDLNHPHIPVCGIQS